MKLTVTVTDHGGNQTTKEVDVNVQTPQTTPAFSTLYGTNPETHMLVIDKPVILDVDATVQGATITATGNLIFPKNQTRTLYVSGHSLVVDGKLTMRPDSHSVTHKVAFRNIDETQFIGAAVTQESHHSDPGLMVHGVWDAVGPHRKAWTNVTAPVAAQATSFAVDDSTGWQVGDEISIAPTERATVSNHFAHTEYRKIVSVANNVVTLDTKLTYPHPFNTAPDGTVFRPEVVNYTRNVQVEGDTVAGTIGASRTTGRAHIMFMSGKQTIKNVAIRHMGPRQMADDGYSYGLLGRYAFHFHRCGEATVGSVIDNLVVRDVGFRGIVPHASHGMTFNECVVDNFHDDGYWWDLDTIEDSSHDLVYNRCIASNGKDDPPIRGYKISGFMLGSGGVNGERRPVADGCISYGMRGSKNASGFQWPSQVNSFPNSEWVFDNCIAHNNTEDGIFTWQNNHLPHPIKSCYMFNSKKGVENGAYGNTFQYEDCFFFNNSEWDYIQHSNSNISKATATTPGGLSLSHHRGDIGNVLIEVHRTPADMTGIFVDTRVRTMTVNERPEMAVAKASKFDFINTGLTPDKVTVQTIHPDSLIRIQTNGQAWKVTATGCVPIPLFA